MVVKVKLSLALTKHHAMDMYGGVKMPMPINVVILL
jgi:hypothetical protein